jgi:hypothetical protein
MRHRLLHDILNAKFVRIQTSYCYNYRYSYAREFSQLFYFGAVF